MSNIPVLSLNTPATVKKIVFCFHWVGGNANAYRALAKLLEAEGILVYGVDLPGRNGKNAIRNMKEIVDSLCNFFVLNGTEKKLNSLPTLFFGHSYGGLLAFELVKKLQSTPAITWKVSHLLLSAVRSPQDLTDFNGNPESFLKHKLTEDALFDYIVGIGGLPAGVSPDFLRIALPSIQADFESFETYNIDTYGRDRVNTPITAFFATADNTEVNKESMLKWSEYTSMRFDFIEFNGGTHYYLADTTFRNTLALEITDIAFYY